MDGVALLVVLSLAANSGVKAYKARRANGAHVQTTLSLARPQPFSGTAPLGQDAHNLRSEAWTLHPGHEVSPRGVVASFILAERGLPATQCDLIDDCVEGDCTLRNLFEQREQAVAGKSWVMQAGGTSPDEQLGARVLGAALKRLPTIEPFQHLLTCNRYGWGACEIDWGISEFEGRRWIVPVWLAPVEARRFRISPVTDELRLFADINRPQGDELRPGKWIVLRRPGRIARAGLMRSAVWPAIGKRLGWRDWMVFSARFGLPLPLASYPDGSTGEIVDAKAIDVAEEIVRKIGSDGGAVKPKSITLEMLEATKTTVSNDKTHGGLIAYANAEMAKLIVGATLTNDNAGSGGASYALGEVHASVRWDNVVFDAERLQEAVRTQIGAAFMRYNNLAGEAPLLNIQVVRDLDPTTLVNIFVRLKNQLGVSVSIEQLRQIAGARAPSGTADEAPGLQIDSFPGASGGLPS